MKVYMFQEMEEIIDDFEYYTNEELFYKYEDAVKYLKEVYKLKIEDIEEFYCEEGESAEDYCDITCREGFCSIYMEERFYVSYQIHEKTIMSFN